MLSEFYGFPVFGLSEDEKFAMQALVPRVKARRRLDDALAGRIDLTPDGWFDAAMAATGSQDLAEAYMHAAIKRSWKTEG